MSLQIRGIQPLAWGTVVTTGYVTESTSEDESTQEAFITDEVADEVTQITGFGVKTDTTLEVIPKSGTVAPVVSDVFTYGTSPDTKSITIITISKKRVNKDVEKWSIKGNAFPNIDLTTP